MATGSSRFGATFVGGGIAVAAFAIYLATLSHNYFGDGVQFAMDVESGDLANLLVPNHMLYPLFGLWFYRGWQLVGWQQGALLPMQVLSAIGGAISVGLMYLLAHRFTKSIPIAAAIAVGFALSYGMWVYSTDSESVTVPLAASMLILPFLMSTRESGRHAGPVVLALLCTFAMLTLQTGVILVVVVVVAYLVDQRLDRSSRIRKIALFVLVSGVLTVAFYLAVAYLVFGVTDVRGLLDWQFHLSETGLWGKPTLMSVAQGGKAFFAALAGYPKRGTALELVTSLIFLVVVIAPFVVALRSLRRLLSAHRRTLAILVTWALLYAAFAIYWVADDISFWVPVVASWWLLVAVVLSEVIGKPSDDGETPARRARYSYVASLIVIAVLLGGRNFVSVISPNLEPNHSYLVAMSVRDHTTSNDLIVTTGGDDNLFLTIPYFAHRTTFSLFHHILNVDQAPSPWVIPSATGRDVENHPNKPAAFAQVDRLIHDTRMRGGQVFLVGTDPGQGLHWSSLEGSGLQPDDLKRFTTKPAWNADDEEFLEVV